MGNVLYYGDNLEVMRLHIKDESVDLIYLDPPFKSNRNYNVLFKEKDGTEAASQIQAFTDTWSWGQDDELLYGSMMLNPALPERLCNTLKAMRLLLDSADMMSYLVMMAPRLLEMRRVMKQTASIYLHCDSSASHYLKLLMDGVFGPENFRNEIVWKRKTGRGETNHKSFKFGCCTDNLLFYSKSSASVFNAQFNAEAEGYDEYTKKFFKFDDGDGRLYQIDNLASPSPRPNLIYEYKGYKPPENGWAISREKMEEWDKEGRLYFPENKTGRIRRKRYLDELRGKPVQNLWDDIEMIASQSPERLGYPTQKPVALLERIISASSNPGDTVLDPFCGCGTAIHAAEKLGRSWIGIDVTHLSISLMKSRLFSAFGLVALTKEGKQCDTDKTYRIKGEPTTLAEAMQLKQDDPHQFEYWALGLVGARPVEEKKGADKGIDGKLFFVGDTPGEIQTIILSVKSGHVNRSVVHELRGVIDREKAAIGVLITMEPPTKNMDEEVLGGGFYESTVWGRKYPRLQILLVEDIMMNGKGIDMPPINQVNATFIKARKEQASGKAGRQTDLF